MEKLLNRIETDLLSTLVGLSGSLKDIACGTRIKIPTDAGYVSYYKSQDSESITFWLQQTMMMGKKNETLQDYNVDDT